MMDIFSNPDSKAQEVSQEKKNPKELFYSADNIPNPYDFVFHTSKGHLCKSVSSTQFEEPNSNRCTSLIQKFTSFPRAAW